MLYKRFAEPTFINVIKITELFLIPDKSNFSPLIWVSTIITIMISLLMILSIIQQQRYVYYNILVVDYLSFILFVGVGKHDFILR